MKNSDIDKGYRVLKHLPNCLTMLRIVIIPLIILTFYMNNNALTRQISAGLFLIASITDFLDGYIARKLGLESPLGEMLDPIADKVLVTSVIMMLVKYQNAPELPCLLILVREFVVSGLREFLGQLKLSIKVSRLAKFKTFLQMFAIILMLLGSKGTGIAMLDEIAVGALWIAAALTVITALSYLKATHKYLFN